MILNYRYINHNNKNINTNINYLSIGIPVVSIICSKCYQKARQKHDKC